MRRDISRVDVRGMIKFFCGRGWQACRPNTAFWELCDLMDRDFAWDVGDAPHQVLHSISGKATVVLVRAENATQTGITKLLPLNQPPIFCIHVLPACTRIVGIRRFKYRKTLRVQPLRTVNACFVLLVDLVQTSDVTGTAKSELQSQQRGSMSELTINTAFGVFEIFPRGGRQYKVNVKGAQARLCCALITCCKFNQSITLFLAMTKTGSNRTWTRRSASCTRFASSFSHVRPSCTAYDSICSSSMPTPESRWTFDRVGPRNMRCKQTAPGLLCNTRSPSKIATSSRACRT